MSIRDKILSASDLKSVPLDLPEWGVKLYVRTMTGADRDAFEQGTADAANAKAAVLYRERLAIFCCFDEKGERIFTPTDLALLGGKSAAVLDRIAQEAMKVNGLRVEDKKDAAKN